MELSDAIKHQIYDLLQTYVERTKNLYLWDAINPNWQRRIRRALRIPPDDTPWAACDATILRNGRIGFALTPQGIYWRTPWFAKVASHGFLPWTKFIALSPEKFRTLGEEEDRGNEVSLAGAAFFLCTFDEDASAVRDLMRAIHHILQPKGRETFPPPTKDDDGFFSQEAPSPETPQPESLTSPQISELVRCAYCGRIWPQWEPTCPACGAPLPLPAFRQRHREKELRAIVFRYLPHIKGLRPWEALDTRKQAAARKAFRLPVEVTPWALYDITLFNSAKRGFILAPTGVYWSHAWPDYPSGTGFLSWKQAAQIWRHFTPKAIREHAVQVGKGIELVILFQEDVPKVAEMFQAISQVLLEGE